MASISFRGKNDGFQVGDNHGLIEFHLPPVRPESPPSPLSTVPFARDPDFISRDTLLHQIHEKSSVSGSRIALVGLGGVGKSQLAIEYSYQVRSQSPATWVFWVHASNEARFEQSFRDIADQIKIPGRQDPKVNIFKLLETWLRDENRGKWLLILDNVDKDQLFCPFSVAAKEDPISSRTNASTKPPLEYIPRSRNGSVITTSRTRDIALKMADHKDLIEVKPMKESEALELLQKKLNQPGEGEEAQQLVIALELMPLAVVQAASYIRNRVPRYSVSQYLRDFEGSDRKATKLLKEEAGHLYRDWEAKNSILVTWQISFDYIRQTKPSAAKLLSLMSLFDRQGIPESLIWYQPQVTCTSSSELLDDSSDGETSESDIIPDFEDDITILRDFSFISVSEDSTIFTMHRLVQLSMRAWLESHGQMDQWREKFINNLYQYFPSGEYENWGKCRLIFPHVKSAMSQRPKSPTSLLSWAALLHKGAWYGMRSGNLATVERFALESWKQREKSLGERHEDTLASKSMLAAAYCEQAQWEKAERLLMDVMITFESDLGSNHPETLTSMANLASLFLSQHRYHDGEVLLLKTIEASRRTFGANDPFLLSKMANLASTYLYQGRFKDAEGLLLQVTGCFKRAHSGDYLVIIACMGNLASTYMLQNRWAEAEKALKEITETSKNKLGKDHPSTLRVISNLASTYLNQGQWGKAEQAFMQVMENYKMKLGEDHPSTLTIMQNLAWAKKLLGHDAEAIKLLRKCFVRQKEVLGLSHPHTLSNGQTLLAWENV